MNKHCKGCDYHHSAGRKSPNREMVKYNDWCCAKGSKVNIGWCITHKAKKTQQEKAVCDETQ